MNAGEMKKLANDTQYNAVKAALEATAKSGRQAADFNDLSESNQAKLEGEGYVVVWNGQDFNRRATVSFN